MIIGLRCSKHTAYLLTYSLTYLHEGVTNRSAISRSSEKVTCRVDTGRWTVGLWDSPRPHRLRCWRTGWGPDDTDGHTDTDRLCTYRHNCTNTFTSHGVLRQ